MISTMDGLAVLIKMGYGKISMIQIIKRLHDRHFSLGFQAGLTLYGSGLKASKIY
ncbi:hypothetical protein [Streptococcus equi]|uniref:hypothetical protein n=1 Tax=Streptococcus equi TaxID=1336 RepID=UPI0013F5C1A1|nr:hypothetical protein [Streptococcus equi]MCD3390213.1 hypothetical protein [Streptococcus equi subsp. zooepidemicus]HEL1148752.1 hypothetical protein [Streptococcus equi subsp. zooepidemicus]